MTSQYRPYVLQKGDSVGRILDQLRTASGMTKGSMAHKLNVHPDTIARYEGDISTISLVQAINYCDQLNIEITVRYR